MKKRNLIPILISILIISCTKDNDYQLPKPSLRYFKFSSCDHTSYWQNTSFIAATSDPKVIKQCLDQLALPVNSRTLFPSGVIKKGNGGYSLKPVIRAYVVENTAAVYGNILPAKVPYHVFTVAGQDTISAISDTTLNNYFMLHGLKTGTYKVEFQSLDSDIVLFSTNVDVFGGTNKDLGIINLAQ